MDPSVVQSAKRTHLPVDSTRNMTSLLTANVYDYGRSSVKLTELERNTTSQQHILNINKGNSGSQMSYFDDARVTVKETVVGLTDTNRNCTPFVINGSDNTGFTSWDPKSTQKESTIYNNYTRPITKNEGMGYAVANYDARATIKQTTLNKNYINQASGYNKEQMNYTAFQDPQKIRYAVHAENYQGTGAFYVNDAENRNQWFNADISTDKEQLIYKAPGQEFRGTNSHLGKISAGEGLVGEIKSNDNLLLKERPNYRIADNVGNINSMLPSTVQLGTTTQQGFHNRNSQIDMFNSKDPSQNYNRFDADVITQQLSNNPWYNIKRNV